MQVLGQGSAGGCAHRTPMDQGRGRIQEGCFAPRCCPALCSCTKCRGHPTSCLLGEAGLKAWSKGLAGAAGRQEQACTPHAGHGVPRLCQGLGLQLQCRWMWLGRKAGRRWGARGAVEVRVRQDGGDCAAASQASWQLYCMGQCGGQQCHRPRPPHCQPCRGTQAPLPPPPQGHSLAFPGGQKGTVRMGVQAGQGEAAGCWGAALTSSAFTPAPSFGPPSPGHGLPPRPAPPGMWHNREQLSWFRCCMETQLPCQGSRAAAVAVQPPTAPTACGSTRKRVSQPGKCPHSATPPTLPGPPRLHQRLLSQAHILCQMPSAEMWEGKLQEQAFPPAHAG